MDDLISRSEAIDALKHNQDVYSHNFHDDPIDKYTTAIIATDIDTLVNLPSAQPEPQWIPVSERLPRDSTWNIFTDGKNISVERYKADAIDHFFPNGRWFQLEDVIAWMPLPEPYKPNEKQSGKERA